MNNVFLFVLFNLTGIITYKIINNKHTSSINTQTDIEYVSVGTQTEITDTDMLTLLEYKKALDNIYSDNVKYDWKFV